MVGVTYEEDDLPELIAANEDSDDEDEPAPPPSTRKRAARPMNAPAAPEPNNFSYRKISDNDINTKNPNWTGFLAGLKKESSTVYANRIQDVSYYSFYYCTYLCSNTPTIFYFIFLFSSLLNGFNIKGNTERTATQCSPWW